MHLFVQSGYEYPLSHVSFSGSYSRVYIPVELANNDNFFRIILRNELTMMSIYNNIVLVDKVIIRAPLLWTPRGWMLEPGALSPFGVEVVLERIRNPRLKRRLKIVKGFWTNSGFHDSKRRTRHTVLHSTNSRGEQHENT